ncbi:MAG: hypothetical protein CMQ05_07660 [Gammaproteobacteria bacterium]|uniref:Nitroreductase family deazaflavin-dependent oxidoreductase n=1 Tax=OM182 bacterium MED-G24 TaxID=1986255 RepID=A0A2A5WZK8_9GAMM|nr:hypothetical protein [Gammaproteobacteria bacterium]PDH41902.1 MAG: hypothetical protein CNE99_00790 [OM182 bacterium MED-G24]RPG27514.1 MAG: DUF385 domain-containing protein [Gammaproteobacteria bacterium TMED50]|tara:strand:+ start:5627 stop:5878 length:252 start_codon:yes stop_codon:yes gene_type:complete
MSQASTARLVLITQSRDDGGHQTDALSYQRVNQDYLVVATNETKNTKPDWYLNLKSDPVVQVELDQMSFYAHASAPTGKDRSD